MALLLRYHRLAWLPLALGLGACSNLSVQGPGDASVSPPAQWRNAEAEAGASLDVAELAAWWTQFGDPVLDQLIVESLENSPDVRTALSRIEEARARRGLERAGLLPSASGGVSARQGRTRDREADTTSSSEAYGASLDASWQVDLFGAQRRSLAAADASLAQTTENYYAAQVSLAAEVANAYVSLRSLQVQFEVTLRNLELREETTQLTLWREEAGIGDTLSSQQAIATLEQTRASIPSLRENIAQTRNALAALVGRTPGALDQLLADARPIPAAPSRIAIGIPAEALRQRPDIRAAERGVEAAVALAQAAERSRFPSLSLSGSIGVDALEAGDLVSPNSVAGSLAAQLAAPIFDAGRIRRNIDIRDEQARQALFTYEARILTALSEVENALISIRETNERLEILRRAIDAAQEAASLASARYEAGAVDIFTVLDAQRTLLSLEEQAVSTTASRTNANIQLYRALGGGWSPLPPPGTATSTN